MKRLATEDHEDAKWVEDALTLTQTVTKTTSLENITPNMMTELKTMVINAILMTEGTMLRKTPLTVTENLNLKSN